MSKAPSHVAASCAEPWLMSSSSAPKHEYDIGVEPGEYMLGVRGGRQKHLNSNARHRRGAQVTGSPFALRHEQDFD